MAFIPVDSTAEVTFIFTASSLTFTNSLYYYKIAGWDLTTLLDLGQTAAETWRDSILPLQCNLVALLGADARDLTTQNSPFINYRFSSVPNGSETDPPASLNNAMCITHRTVLAGRSFRGRTYITGLPETSSDIDSWDVSFTNSMVTAFELMQSIIASASGADPVVVSRYANKAPRANGVVTPITSYDANPLIASQRRRIPR